jgi:AAA domain, putative AbiEii toxin, Type IV TA system
VSWNHVRVRFFVNGPRPSSRPSVHLRRDNWDDFGFKTMYWVSLWLSTGQEVELGAVKVLRRGMGHAGGRVDLSGSFDSLSSEYCSLGQAPSYYEALQGADTYEPGIALDYLHAIRDVSLSTPVLHEFEQEPGFDTSLLRDASARQALEIGQAIWTGAARSTTRGRLSFEYTLPGVAKPFNFHFGRSTKIPTRIFGVTGYNGVGKTRLLSSLGMITAADDSKRASPDLLAKHGGFEGNPPDISTVVCISYSAFDDFEVPELSDGVTSDARLGRAYFYCGLRRSNRDTGSIGKSELKSIDEMLEEFVVALEKVRAKLRRDELDRIFAPLLREPSFSMGGTLPPLDASTSEWASVVRGLSTGHKIVLNILVQLCSILEQRSLVLFDEPEMHLHPPLIAALLKAIQVALETYDSFAIVATHSPVVAQEIPGQNVVIVRRAQRLAVAEDPEIETYGEHIGILTSRIFDLDNTESDFRGVLRALARTMPIDAIERLFPLGLSSQARVIVRSEARTTSE